MRCRIFTLCGFTSWICHGYAPGCAIADWNPPEAAFGMSAEEMTKFPPSDAVVAYGAHAGRFPLGFAEPTFPRRLARRFPLKSARLCVYDYASPSSRRPWSAAANPLRAERGRNGLADRGGREDPCASRQGGKTGGTTYAFSVRTLAFLSLYPSRV